METEKTLLSQFQAHVDRIDEELRRALTSRVSLMEEIGRHSVLSQGKRFRPLLFVLSCHLCGYHGEDVYRLSTIFEHIHAASLLHDDVLDNAETRRRKPSANQVWGNHAAVLEGDFLYLKASRLALHTRNIPFMNRIIEAATKMTEGQILESIHTNDWNTGKQEYMEIISNKTGELISSACACGGIISGAEAGDVASLAEFGLNMGIAFQLMDDLLDYTALEENMGKPVGKDLREGKITLPLIYTLALLERSERKHLQDVFYRGRATEADYRDLIEKVRGNGVLEKIHDEARTYVTTAEKRLSLFPRSPSKHGLLDLNQYVVQRDH